MNERLGLTESQQRLRDMAIRNLSPAARHQAFPHLFAKPMPSVDPAADAKAQVARLTRENEALRDKIQGLEDRMAGMIAHAVKREATIAEVQEAFCKAYSEAGGRAGGEPYTIAHLKSARRSRATVWPRHVCMDLCKRICATKSLPAIGREFGGRDHTTTMSGISNTPDILTERTELALVHAQILARFGARA